MTSTYVFFAMQHIDSADITSNALPKKSKRSRVVKSQTSFLENCHQSDKMERFPLCTDLQVALMDFLSPMDFVRFTGVCRDTRKLQTLDHSHNGALKLCRVMSAVFDQKRNVLIHGPGGAGKTHTIHAIHKMASDLGKRIIVTGTTGVCSSNLPQGMTLHSFSGLGKATIPFAKLQEECNDHPEKAFKRYKQWRQVDILVIDEVSMMGTRLFRLVEWLARFVRQDPRPFGGIQIIFSGDFLQLPPVGDSFVFTLPEWQTLNLVTVPFTTSYRQKDDRHFFKMLQRIRLGMHTDRDIERLQTRRIDKVPDHIVSNVGITFVPPFMFSRHEQVDKLNHTRLHSFPGNIIPHNAVDSFVTITSERDPVTRRTRITRQEYQGPPVVVPPALKDRIQHRQPDVLQMKANAQYILTQNFRTTHKLVNGAICMLISSNANENRPDVCHFPSGRKISMDAFMTTQYYRIFPGQNIYLKRTQYALRPGYAITIHGAQGMTLDEAVIDAGTSVFASAQTYVACSRVRRLENLYLLDFHPKSLKVHQEARIYVANLECVDLPPVAPVAPVKKRAYKRKQPPVLSSDDVRLF
jgi:hypothetical protein